jgi:ABC-type Na+ efflux pump permease subunit
MKNTSRTIFIFLILLIVVLVSGVSISIFLLSKETQLRKDTEVSLQDMRNKAARIEASLKESQKQIEILEGKNKDADDRINNLLDEINVEKGLRDEVKSENKKLKETLEAEAKSKQDIRQKLLKELEDAQAKIKVFEAQVGTHKGTVDTLQKKLLDLEEKNQGLEKQIQDLSQGLSAGLPPVSALPEAENAKEDKVDLNRIVVTPDSAKEGRVLSVDTETDFLIFDLGSVHGIKSGDVMSVYRGKSYLGDVKVSRVQEEMSAADFIAPLVSRKVRKNDQLVPKR